MEATDLPRAVASSTYTVSGSSVAPRRRPWPG